MSTKAANGSSSLLRFDQQVIASWIPTGARVLDLGCDRGVMLKHLVQHKGVTGVGIEHNEERAAMAIAAGLNVIHGDINEEIVHFPAGHFDVVIVSQTMQQVYNPSKLLRALLRVGRRGIVSFPNFGYWRVRIQAFFKGHAPKTKELPYEWHDTPNIRVLTLNDFKQYGADIPFTVEEEISLMMPEGQGSPKYIHFLPNLRASYGLYMISGA